MSTSALRPLPPRMAAPQGGFTMLEMMIAAAIGMILLLATLSIFDTTDRARAEMAAGNEVFQTGAFALKTMQADLKLAGFYGQGGISTNLPATAPDPCSTSSSDWLAALPLGVQGWTAGTGQPSCVPSSAVAGSAIVAVRRASTCVVGGTGCSAGAAGTALVQLSQCMDEAAPAKTATALGDLTLKGRDCASTAPVRQYYTRIYFLDGNNVSGDGIPTLKRMELVNGAWKTVTVAQGVEQMRVRYGLDLTRGDAGAVEVWTSDPTTEGGCGASDCPIRNWTNVSEMKLHLLLKGSASQHGRAESKTYTLGDITVTPADDGYRRSLISSAVSLANVAGGRP